MFDNEMLGGNSGFSNMYTENVQVDTKNGADSYSSLRLVITPLYDDSY